jgi:RNA polymerase sigma factor (sigma-70 family)
VPQEDREKQFERLVRENELLIQKVCRIYSRTETERQDLFQEIVIQLWKSFGKFRGDSKFSTWLYRVAINTAITGLRREKKWIASTDDLPVELSEAEGGHEEEQLQQLYAAIEQLNEIEKAIVVLYLEDRSYEEMEDILGTNSGNLRVKMNRIKEKLRQMTKNN